ncbi:MAG: CCA tRNA nucleotidyltransferase [Erysipelotrichaceae bacterium]|nr:CCA tRNA nucleotidyltransferase [Erysipelotrichaceae bacterium]
MSKIPFSQTAYEIVKLLQNNGYEAYLVGGCVRDGLMGKASHDEDITTNAHPKEVMRLFKDDPQVLTGLKHGTVSIIRHHELYEITTFREDFGSDGRRPESISFADSLEDDVKRRDLTINALAYDPVKDEIIDYVGGVEDLNNHMIRTVGEASVRFKEDYLRMMRAIRFTTQLGFNLDPIAIKAIQENVEGIHLISMERIKAELDRIMVSDKPSIGIRLLRESGLLKAILPEVDVMFETPQNTPYHIYDVGEHTMRVVDHIQPLLHRRYAALFHDIGKPDARFTKDGIDHFYGHAEISYDLSLKIMTRLKFSRNDRELISLMVLHHDEAISTKRRSMIRYYMKNSALMDEHYNDMRDLWLSDCFGQSQQQYESRVADIEIIDTFYQSLFAGPHTLKDLAVNGYDIIKLKDEAGEQLVVGVDIREVLERLRHHVIQFPQDNNRERLLTLVPGLYKSLKTEQKQKKKTSD